jgi:ribose 5-phosphate isomerase
MEAGLSVYELDQLNQLDLTIDGADEVDASLNCNFLHL